jgi:SAM-dependent methyltransferase
VSEAFISCWNDVLTPKWVRFRHILSGNGKIHSDRALPRFGVRDGDRVLDIGCGFGETCLELAKLVGASGEVVGIDCTQTFIDIANRERDAAGATQVRYEIADAQVAPLPAGHFDFAFSRFGVMFFESAVRALRNTRRSLKPDGRLGLIVWRRLADNPCWGLGKSIALEHLPPPGPQAQTCGPGPFSWADEETDRQMLAAAGFGTLDLFERLDADICMGRTIDEAVAFQILVGPSGEIIREAGALGEQGLPAIKEKMAAALRPYLRDDGVWLPSSTWMIVARA